MNRTERRAWARVISRGELTRVSPDPKTARGRDPSRVPFDTCVLCGAHEEDHESEECDRFTPGESEPESDEPRGERGLPLSSTVSSGFLPERPRGEEPRGKRGGVDL